MAARHVRALLCCLSLVVACGGGAQRTNGPSAEEAARAHAAERLQGHWLLVDFRPEEPLEPVLAGLLRAQLGQMTLDVSGRQLTASGVGLRADRTFDVMHATGAQAVIAILDQNRLDYEISANFRGNELAFVALTPPWRGQGRLQRLH